MINTTLSFLGEKNIENLELDRCHDLSNTSYLIMLKHVNPKCLSYMGKDKLDLLINRYTNICNKKEIPDVIVEQDGIKEFYLKHPKCAVWDLWEIYAYDICIEYNFTIDITLHEPKQCKLIADIVYNKNLGGIIRMLSNSYNKNYNYNKKDFAKKCIFDYNITFKDNNCVSKEQYIKLRQAGITTNTITESCKHNVTISSTDPLTLTTSGKKYVLGKDFYFK